MRGSNFQHPIIEFLVIISDKETNRKTEPIIEFVRIEQRYRIKAPHT